MGGESPVVELYDSNGNPLSVQNGSAIPASTPGLLLMGSDGTNSRYITVDSSGRPIVVGAGTAGSPAGGVISIQGVASGTVVPITGTVASTQNGNIDAGNSSTTTLVGNGTFTGTGIDVSVYGIVTVFVFADQAGTLNLEWSINNTNWDDVNSYSVSASTALSVQFGPQARFFRVVYQNGSVAQGAFRLQTIERPITAFPETVPASYTITNGDNVLLTKTVQGTSPWVENITQFGGTNISTGTGAGGAGIPRVTVSNDSNILATQSGTWTVQQGSPPWTVSQATAANLNVTVVNGVTAESTAAWTSSTTVNTTLQLNVSGFGTVAVTLNQGSTITGGVVTFEVSDTSGGTNWYPIAVVPTTASVPSSTYTLVASTNATFQASVPGYVLFRVRLSTVISGTATVNVGIAASSEAVDGQDSTYITDGTHGPVAVKAASTAAAAADPSLVVGLSPNSPLPAGTNIIGALSANQSVNLAQVAGSTTAVLGTGEQKVAAEGLAASGSAVSGNPVLVAGADPLNAHTLLTDTSGRQVVVGAAADGGAVAGFPVLVAGRDASGNAREPLVEATFRQQLVVEPSQAAAMGLISTNPIAEMAFGYVASSAKTTIPVRATTYTQISGAPVQVSVKSASANDASAGTGTRTITITYLTTGAVRKTETITMNGTTAVNSVNTDYAFIEKVVSSTAGSGRTNAGIITVFQGTGGTGTALCSIVAGDGRTNLCHHYVTSGKTCYITNLIFSSNSGVGTNGNVFLQITNPAETDVLEQFCSSFRTAAQLSSFQINFNPPIKAPQSDITNGSLIIAYVTPDATTGTNWWVSFSYYEV